MAKRPSAGDELRIKLGLDGQAEWENFRKQLKGIAGEVQGIATEIKRIENIGKATVFRDMMAGGRDQFLSGTQFQAGRKARATMRMGTESGQNLQNIKDELSLINQVERAMQRENALARAKNVELSANAAEIKKISDLTRLSEQIEAVRVRRAQEWYAGNRDNANILKQQLDLLRQQESALKTKPIISPEQKLAQDRQRNMQRLFGDGGAGLMTIQAGLMANYAGLNALTSGIQASVSFAIELDAALRNLQAITVTTDGNMGALKETIISVAEQTKFSAVEVANAAIILGQAGMSVNQIQKAIGAVALLATATGTDLSKAVDIATSTLDVFNMEASQMGHVADVLTSAVNQSKLDIEKLTLGLQYAGNTAAQSGATFEELTAALGAMSNAGIRSGSTLGTGMRQILISLEKPSETFLETLARLGLTMEDVNIKSNGIYGALKNLRDAGFTASDAIQSFEIRGAAAFTALSGNLDSMLNMEEGFVNSTAAIRANETQMRSFKNVLENFRGVFLSVVETGIQPFLYGLRDILVGLTDFLEKVRVAKPAIQILTASLVSLAGAFAIIMPLRLLANIPTVIKGMLTIGTAAGAAATGVGLLGTAFRILTGPIGLVVTAITLGIGAFVAYQSETARTQRSIDELRTDFDNANGAMEEQKSKVEMVAAEIDHLNDRFNSLSSDSKLLSTEINRVRNQFATLGMDVDKPINSVGELISELSRLRTELSEEYLIKIGVVRKSLQNLMEGQETELKKNRSQVSELTTDYSNTLTRRGLNASSSALDILGQLQDPNLRADQIKVLQLQLDNRLAELEEDYRMANSRQVRQKYTTEGIKTDDQGNPVRPSAIDIMSATSAERDLLAGLFPIVAEMLPRVTERQAAQTEAQRIARDQLLTKQRNSPSYQALNSSVATVSSGASLALDNSISSIPETDVGGRGRAAAQALADGQARVQALQKEVQQYADTLMANKDLRESGVDETIRQELLSALNSLDAELIQKAQTYIDNGKKEDENLRQADMKRIGDELKAAQDKLGEANGYDELGTVAGEITDLFIEQYKKQIEIIDASDATFNEKKAQRDAAARDLDASLNSLGKQMTEQGAEFDQTDLENRTRGIQTQIDTLQAARENSNSAAEVDALTTQIVELITARNKLENEAAGLENKDQTFIDDLNAKMAREVENIKMSGEEQKKDLLEEAVRIFQKSMADLQTAADQQDQLMATQMEQANSPAEVTAIQNNRVAAQTRLREALLAIVAQIEEMGFDFDDTELNTLLFAIAENIRSIGEDADNRREDLAKVAADEAEKVKSDRLEQLKADEEAKKAAYENAKELAKEAYGQADRAAKMKAAMEALSTYLAAAVERIKAEFADSPAGVLESMLTAFNFDVAVPEQREISAPDFGKKGGGGGGKKQSALEKATDELDARVKAYASMLEAKLITGASGVAKIDTLVGDIKAKVAEIDKQIASMQAGVDGGNMSKKDLEKLNELLDSRKKLTETAAQAESMLTDEMVRQGDYWGAAKNIAVNWAKDNLDMVDAFTSGIQDVLSTMTNGFATLFTDLVNGTKSGKQAFRDFAISVIGSVQKMIAQMIAMWMMQKLIGMATGTGAVAPGSFAFAARTAVGLPTSMTGGMVRKAGGGMVEGNLARDSKLHLLMPGEYVMRKTAVDMMGVDTLDQINAMGNRTMAKGGHFGAAKQEKGALGMTNVYVVSPDQKPVPGPGDIIAVINDDIARGGPTKKLIKSVAMGY